MMEMFCEFWIRKSSLFYLDIIDLNNYFFEKVVIYSETWNKFAVPCAVRSN